MQRFIPITRSQPHNRLPLAVAQDTALWDKFRNGNHDALAQLYKMHLRGLYQHGLYICRDTEMVNDSIQELFSRLWTQRERISSAQNIKFYLYRSLERILIAQLVRQRKSQSELQFTEEILADSFEQIIINGEIKKERLKEVKKCIQSLPKCQREVILLKFFNDLSYPEISEIMGVHVNSLYNLTSKAIEQLRGKLVVNC